MFGLLHKLVERIVTWREKHLTEQQFVLILAFFTGLAGASAALILKWLIHTFQHLLTMYFVVDGANYLYLLYPVVGILIAGLFVRYVVRDDIGHGVTKILYAISQRKSIIKAHNMYTSVIGDEGEEGRIQQEARGGAAPQGVQVRDTDEGAGEQEGLQQVP